MSCCLQDHGAEERSEAALVLSMLITASVQLIPPDLPALRYVIKTCLFFEVRSLDQLWCRAALGLNTTICLLLEVPGLRILMLCGSSFLTSNS